MRLRLRQIAVAVTDLAAARADAEAIFGVGHAHEDPGVARYGLRNAVYRLGNTFLEILTPVADGTTVGRLLAKQGSDCGYMVILQTDKIDEARARIMEAGVRVVDQLDRSGAGFTHLHPRDVGGTLLSIDYMGQWERWEWGGPDWGIHPAPDCSIVAAEMHGAEPEVMAKRWSTVLDRPCSDGGHGWHIALYEGELRFVRNSDVRGEGLCVIDLRCPQPEAIRERAAERGCLLPDGSISMWGMTVRLLGGDSGAGLLPSM